MIERETRYSLSWLAISAILGVTICSAWVIASGAETPASWRGGISAALGCVLFSEALRTFVGWPRLRRVWSGKSPPIGVYSFPPVSREFGRLSLQFSLQEISNPMGMRWRSGREIAELLQGLREAIENEQPISENLRKLAKQGVLVRLNGRGRFAGVLAEDLWQKGSALLHQGAMKTEDGIDVSLGQDAPRMGIVFGNVDQTSSTPSSLLDPNLLPASPDPVLAH